MRTAIVAGNWKMNNDLEATRALISDLKKETKTSNAKVIIAPTFVNLSLANDLLKDSSIEVAAQNMHFADHGAYTGEVSASMLKSVGVNTVILGHSERRALFHEEDEILAQKVNAALEYQMQVIFCIGEQLEDRKKDNHFKVVETQIKNALFHLSESDWSDIILAYEPVWAIGTGETATPEQAQEMHEFLRKVIRDTYGDTCAEQLSILYGGSVKPNNAKDIFSKPDVDGGLIGGASLKAKDFFEIVNSI